jgi:4-hydroxybenzoate polyprenyltransferase
VSKGFLVQSRTLDPQKNVRERLSTYRHFVKIEHTLFSFPLLLSGALLADSHSFTVRTFFLILLAGTGARTSALGLNRIFDRRFDRDNPRTASRELPRGAMTPTEAWLVTLIGAIIYALAAYLISPRCLVLAPIPLAIFVVYPLLKRVTIWAHLGVGLALSMAPIGAWYAVALTFQGMEPALVLGLFTVLWVSGFDIIYSTLDEEYDRRTGLRSLPARLGKRKALRISMIFHFAAFGCLALLYWMELRGTASLLLLLLVGGLLYLEHRKASEVELAFFKINSILGFVVLAFVYAGVNVAVP